MSSRRQRATGGPNVKAAANPEAAAFARQERVQRELAAKATRRTAAATRRRWVFSLDPDRNGAGRRMLVPIRGNEAAIAANGGEHNLRFVDYVYQTDHPVIRDHLRALIAAKKLRGVTETINPVVQCTVPGCDDGTGKAFKGTWDEMKIHFQANHVGTPDEDIADEGDAPEE